MNQLPSMDQVFLKKLTDILEANLSDEHLGVEEVSRQMGLSRSQIHRKLKKLCQQSFTEFLREMRLKHAMELLQQQVATAAEIAYRVGFGSPAYFNKCFHDYYGYPPGEVKKRDLPPGAGILENARVAEQEPSHHKNHKRGSRQLSFKNVMITLVIVLASLTGIYILYSVISKNTISERGEASKKPGKSIVVFPFKNLSNNADDQYFADGITENILNLLSRIKELRVVSRTTAEQFRKKPLTIPEIAKKLNVTYVLEGSVSKLGNKVEIFVQLIDSRTDQSVMSEKFESETTDIFEIQSTIAKEVASKLETVISPRETTLIEKAPTQNAEAYDSYLLGRFFLKKRTEADTKVSMEYFKKSIRQDPGFALAYTGLADVHWLRAWWAWGPRTEDYRQCRNLVIKALQLDPNLSEAHTVLGKLLIWGEWKWEEARQELKLAIELNPNYADAHCYYAELLNVIGEEEEARKEINRSLELDPYFITLNTQSALFYFYQGDYNNAIKEYKRTLELFSPDGKYNVNDHNAMYNVLFKCYVKLGDDPNALEALRSYFLGDRKTARNADRIQKLYDESGMMGIMNFVIESELSKSYIDTFFLASLYSLLGRKNEALDYLEKIMLEHTAAYAGSDYHVDALPAMNCDYADWNNIRSEPRYLALIRQMGLDKYNKPMKP